MEFMDINNHGGNGTQGDGILLAVPGTHQVRCHLEDTLAMQVYDGELTELYLHTGLDCWERCHIPGKDSLQYN